jgi:adenylylsulfate kinase
MAAPDNTNARAASGPSQGVDRLSRETQNGHRAVVLWMTGFSGSGKSTLSRALESALFDRGCRVVVLDGDVLRGGICSDLGFSIEDRSENIRRAGEISRLFLESGLIVIAAFISPLKADRALARGLFSDGDFLEIHCDASLEVCERRDVKGLYKKARRGEIPLFTGITSPYEVPEDPEFRVGTGEWSLQQCVDYILDGLAVRGVLSPQMSS